MSKNDIRDSKGIYVGYSTDDGSCIKYWGVTKGYIGWYNKKLNRWYWAQGPKVNQLGPMGDIGFSEVLKAERTS